MSGLGDQSLPGVVLTLSGTGQDIHFFAYFWRDRNVVATFIGTDYLGDLSKDSCLNIAKEIDFRATG